MIKTVNHCTSITPKHFFFFLHVSGADRFTSSSAGKLKPAQVLLTTSPAFAFQVFSCHGRTLLNWEKSSGSSSSSSATLTMSLMLKLCSRISR